MKSFITKQDFHSEMCRLLTNKVAINKAVHIRDMWAKGNPEEAKAPFHPEARIRASLDKRDYNKRINLSNLGGKVPQDLFRKAKHHNYLCTANTEVKSLEIRNKLQRLKNNGRGSAINRGRRNNRRDFRRNRNYRPQGNNNNRRYQPQRNNQRRQIKTGSRPQLGWVLDGARRRRGEGWHDLRCDR